MGVRRVPGRSTFLTIVSWIVDALLKRRVLKSSYAYWTECSVKLEAKLVGLVGIKAELLKGI